MVSIGPMALGNSNSDREVSGGVKAGEGGGRSRWEFDLRREQRVNGGRTLVEDARWRLGGGAREAIRPARRARGLMKRERGWPSFRTRLTSAQLTSPASVILPVGSGPRDQSPTARSCSPSHSVLVLALFAFVKTGLAHGLTLHNTGLASPSTNAQLSADQSSEIVCQNCARGSPPFLRAVALLLRLAHRWVVKRSSRSYLLAKGLRHRPTSFAWPALAPPMMQRTIAEHHVSLMALQLTLDEVDQSGGSAETMSFVIVHLQWREYA